MSEAESDFSFETVSAAMILAIDILRGEAISPLGEIVHTLHKSNGQSFLNRQKQCFLVFQGVKEKLNTVQSIANDVEQAIRDFGKVMSSRFCLSKWSKPCPFDVDIFHAPSPRILATRCPNVRLFIWPAVLVVLYAAELLILRVSIEPVQLLAWYFSVVAVSAVTFTFISLVLALVLVFGRWSGRFFAPGFVAEPPWRTGPCMMTSSTTCCD